MAETSKTPLRNVEPNKLIHLANLMRGGQDKLNYLRGAGVGPLGDLFLGPATDVVEGAAYGEAPVTGSGQTTQLDPGTFDLAAMGSVPATVGKNVLQKLMAKKLRDAPNKDGIYQQLAKGGINEKGVNQQIAQGAVPAAAIGTAKYNADQAKLAMSKSQDAIGFNYPGKDGVSGKVPSNVIRDIVDSAPQEIIEDSQKYMDNLVAKYSDDFEPKGFNNRMAMTHPEGNVFKGDNLAPSTKQIKEANSWFRSQSYEKQKEIIEHWQVTGKYPKGAEKMKNAGTEFRLNWVERHMDQNTGSMPYESKLNQYISEQVNNMTPIYETP